MNERQKISSVTPSNIIHGRVERPPGRVVPTMEQRNVETVSSNDPGLMDEAVNTMEDDLDLPLGYTTPLSSALINAYKWMHRVLNKDKETCEETYIKEAMTKLREELDDISRVHVVWDPYRSHRDQHPFQEIAWFKGSLLCCEVCELYNPDRVKRQFGRAPNIPLNHVPSTTDLSELAEKLSSWEDNCISIEKCGDIMD